MLFAMNILNDILDTLGLKATIYFRTDFSSPWAITVPDFESAARFHLVIQGSCYVRFPSSDSYQLNAGDMIIIPKGQTHIISDQPNRPSETLESVLSENPLSHNEVLILGDADPTASTQMLCGHFMFSKGADHPILHALPQHVMATNSTRAENPWLDDVLRLITRRAFSSELSSPASLRRLSEVVFIELLQIGINRSPELKSIISGLHDKQIGHALKLIHDDPSYAWSVNELAKQVAMSRSRFAERFSNLLGVGPMTYLIEWRLQKALKLMSESQQSIQRIAQETGYQSAAAFTRAFSTKFGIPPKQYRQQAN